MRLLLDSSTYSLFMRGHEQVTKLVRRADEVLFSAIVVDKLMYGFRRGTPVRAECRRSPDLSLKARIHPSWMWDW